MLFPSKLSGQERTGRRKKTAIVAGTEQGIVTKPLQNHVLWKKDGVLEVETEYN